MAAKGKLDAMLSNESSKPVIRRGQGVRLSTEEPTAEPAAEVPVAQNPVIAESQNRTPAKSHNRTITESQPGEQRRVNRGYMLREDLILACKQAALSDGRKLYEVMEEALAEYLSRREQAAQ